MLKSLKNITYDKLLYWYNANMNQSNFFNKLKALQDGAYYVKYKDKKYLLNKETLLNSKLIKIYANELGGNDIVSGNYYTTIKDGLLKPCEMSEAKVIDFILNLEVL